MKKYNLELLVFNELVYWKKMRTFKGACHKAIKMLRKSKICDIKVRIVSNFTGEIMIEMGR